MKVRLAKTAGFCYGVQRAVDAVYSELEKDKRKIYTYGPIVHNETVISELEARGVGIIPGREELERLCLYSSGKADAGTKMENGREMKKAGSGKAEDCSFDGPLSSATVIIRAHGVSAEEEQMLKASGAEIIDATCPFVKKIHKIVKEHYAAGEHIIVTGSREHPEVAGILGQINNDAVVIGSAEEAENLDLSETGKYCLVSQTTFSVQKFKDIVDIFSKKRYIVNVVNTICNATQMRQEEALALSGECDAMIVIGGKNSSNTAKLYDICRKLCEATYYIQSSAELEGMLDSSVRCVGITAGASTPKSIIEEVVGICQR